MKPTATQALLASKAGLILALFQRIFTRPYRPALMVALALTAIIGSFLLGRETATSTHQLKQAMASLQLDIMLQQRDVDRVLQDNRSTINALAVRLAELQAASTRIDAMGERLAQMGQLTLDEFDFNRPAPVGGPADPASSMAASEEELQGSIAYLGEKLRRQASQLDALQALMVNRQFENDLTPTGWPVRKGWISSRFGERNDPFTGQRANHRGLDFAGTRGSDVVSVASGVVVWAGNRRGYGKTVEIDHGNGYQTRYAHAESLEVEPGDHVTAGQMIARMGSTGRASAPHVHFEVLQNGVTVNPQKFVSQLR